MSPETLYISALFLLDWVYFYIHSSLVAWSSLWTYILPRLNSVRKTKYLFLVTQEKAIPSNAWLSWVLCSYWNCSGKSYWTGTSCFHRNWGWRVWGCLNYFWQIVSEGRPPKKIWDCFQKKGSRYWQSRTQMSTRLIFSVARWVPGV